MTINEETATSISSCARSARELLAEAFEELQRAKADYALAKALNRLDRYALVVIDDIGYVRKDEAETSVLFELVMHRYERRSLLVTSNQPFSEWENVFSTSAMTVAAVDQRSSGNTCLTSRSRISMKSRKVLERNTRMTRDLGAPEAGSRAGGVEEGISPWDNQARSLEFKKMADDDLSYQGASREALDDILKSAIAILSDKKPEDVDPASNGDYIVVGDSAGIVVTIETDPSALVFRATLLDGVKESSALLALINEINVDIAIGQIYFYDESSQIKYYYRYPAENPSPQLVASIINEMCDEADLYDDRLKVRLGGERFIEQSDDEIEV